MSSTYTVVRFVVSHNNMFTILFCCLPQYHAHYSILLSSTIQRTPFRFATPVLLSTNQVSKIWFSLFIMSSRKISSVRKDNILTYFDFFALKCVSLCVCVYFTFQLFLKIVILNKNVFLRHGSHQILPLPKFPIISQQFLLFL
jgi:hypothetical protein